MARKAKEESLDLFYLNEKQEPKGKKKGPKGSKKQPQKTNKNKVQKEQKTKEGKFDFDEEIIIGLKRIDPPIPAKKTDKKRAEKMANQYKQKKKQEQVRKSQKEYNIDISDIYSKQNKQKQEEGKNTKSNSKKQNGKKANKKIPKQVTKEQEKARKKRRIAFKIIKWTTLLAIVIGAIIYALMSPIFNVANIKVEGNNKISEEEIISLSKIENGQNMFRYRESDIINNIKINPYIAEVEVNRQLPDGIVLKIVERKATFVIPIGNAKALINNQGYILEVTNKKQKLPILKGVVTDKEQIVAGNRLVTEDLEKLGDVLKIMESATSNNIAESITQIDITNKNNYILRLSKEKKNIYLGDTTNLSTKMLWIITFNKTEGKTEGDIILNLNLNSERPYFRKKV